MASPSQSMTREADTLVLIPARMASKSVPRKNLRPVGGKPLVCWTLEAALSALPTGRVVVSTDDPDLATIALKAGGEVPFMRPKEYATDTSLAIEVALHCLQWFRENENWQPHSVLLLQPTSPLRTAHDILEAMALFREKPAASVVGVCPSSHPGEWLKRITEEGLLIPWQNGADFPQRRQDASATYDVNGAIYLVRTEALLSQKTFYAKPTYAYQMPRERSLDIDTPWDFHLADLILQERESPSGERIC